MRTPACFLIAITIACGSQSGRSLADYGGGTGTPEDPYLIGTAEHMNQIGLHPEDWDKHFRLVEDIDLSVYAPNEFNLIGAYRAAQDPNERLEVPFSGVFDGQGHTIANFRYEVAGDEDPSGGWVHGIGLFRLIDGANARIEDLIVVDPNLRPSSTCVERVGTIGALAGIVNSGLIIGCRVEGGHIEADGLAGGLVGSARGRYGDGVPVLRPTVSHCAADCEVVVAAQRPFSAVERADRLLGLYFGGMLGSMPESSRSAPHPVWSWAVGQSVDWSD